MKVMSIHLSSFLNLIFVGFVALFPPVNPVGTALIVDPFLSHLSMKERRRAVMTISFYCLIVCLFSTLFGGVFFKFFGISLPVVQLAGGIFICRMGWEVLLSKQDDKNEEKAVDSTKGRQRSDIRSLLFFPLAFPTTTGAGTISVLLALSANSYDPVRFVHVMNLMALGLASLLMCVLIFICYYFAPAILSRVSEQGHQVLNRLSGFLTFCVGLQIFVNGITGLVRSFHVPV